MKTHRETYPEQYNHPLCGKTVRVVTPSGYQCTDVVERVVPSGFGPMAMFAGRKLCYLIHQCHEVHPDTLEIDNRADRVIAEAEAKAKAKELN